MNKKLDKLGLALGGGGSLGSYEMGVWAALRELNVHPEVISGTSIGALIGAFMTADKYDVAVSLWQNVSPDKVMKNGLNFDWVTLRKTFQKDRQKIVTFTKSYIKNRGADISPLIELVQKSLSPVDIINSPIRFGVVAVQLPFFIQKNIDMNKVVPHLVHDWLFASSAIWPLFPVRSIGKETYIDGGYKDTLPIKFAFELGATKVVAVNLFYKIAWHPLLNRRTDVINIEPSWNLGAPFNFDQSIINRNRTLGYNDTMKKIGGLVGYRYTFKMADCVLGSETKMFDIINQSFAQEKNQLITLLRRHTKGKIPAGHYFLRGLEVVAEILRISPEPIYEVGTLMTLVIETIEAQFDTHEVVHILKKIRAEKQLTSAEQKTALKALKYVLETRFHTVDIHNWISYKAKYILMYVMLLLMHEKLC